MHRKTPWHSLLVLLSQQHRSFLKVQNTAVHWVLGVYSALVFLQRRAENLCVATVVTEQLPGEAAISVQAENGAGELSQQKRQTFTQQCVNPNSAAAILNYQKAPFFQRAGSERRCGPACTTCVHTLHAHLLNRAVCIFLTAVGLSGCFVAVSPALVSGFSLRTLVRWLRCSGCILDWPPRSQLGFLQGVSAK